jgi:hypothetical protein
VNLITSSSSFSVYVGLVKRRVRRLYFAFGDGIFLIIDVPGVGGAGVVAVVLSIVGGIRCEGVDEPNAITVDLVCKTRFIRAELVNAKIRTREKLTFHLIYI